jgi:tRNA(Ile)-lysidine synthase
VIYRPAGHLLFTTILPVQAVTVISGRRERLARRGKKLQAGCMGELLQRVEDEIRRHRLFLRGQKILVAVSGGADSLVLLSVLNSLAPENRWRLSVAHFNHQLRGRASDADEKLVRATAKKMSLPFSGERGEVAAYARQAKISVEMAARKLRHEFLARVARAEKIPVVALAHHADDQVELFFLRLLRGTGGEGLAGMKWRSPSPADPRIALVRPLLGCAKAGLREFACENKIRFRDDATNFSSDFLRNRIRNQLLPLLEKNYQPGLTRTVLRLMEITGAESEFVSAAARNFCGRRGHESPIKTRNQKSGTEYGGDTSDAVAGSFDRLPLAVQRKVLLRQLTELGLVSDFELVEQLRAAPGKWVSVSPFLSIARDATGMLSRRKIAADAFNTDELKLSGRAGRGEFGGLEFRWTLKKHSGARRHASRPAEFFDAGKIGGEVILRHWRAGDRFQPIGLSSPAKLQDLFVNAKIPAARRRELVVAVAADGEIFWVEGLRIGEKFKLTPATQNCFCWHFAPSRRPR